MIGYRNKIGYKITAYSQKDSVNSFYTKRVHIEFPSQKNDPD